MKRFFLLLSFVVAGGARLCALGSAADGSPLCIALRGGLGYSAVLNMGVAPYTDPGACFDAGLELSKVWNAEWSSALSATGRGGLYLDGRSAESSASVWSGSLELKGWRHIAAPRTSNFFSVGASLRETMVLYMNSNLQNATLGAGSFSDFSLLGRVVRPLRDRRLGVSRALHLELGLAPVSAQLSPGYAYIDNFTAVAPVSRNYLDSYVWHLKAFGAWEGRLGMQWAFFNRSEGVLWPSSSLWLDYRWFYLSTGNSAQHRLDLVYHSLGLTWNIPTSGHHTKYKKLDKQD